MSRHLSIHAITVIVIITTAGHLLLQHPSAHHSLQYAYQYCCCHQLVMSCLRSSINSFHTVLHLGVIIQVVNLNFASSSTSIFHCCHSLTAVHYSFANVKTLLLSSEALNLLSLSCQGYYDICHCHTSHHCISSYHHYCIVYATVYATVYEHIISSLYVSYHHWDVYDYCGR